MRRRRPLVSLVTEAQMRGLLLFEEAGLSADQMALWESVRIEPEVWKAPQDADYGFGFWVVAVKDRQALWFDSLSNLFKLGTFEGRGQIAHDQDRRGTFAEAVSWLGETG